MKPTQTRSGTVSGSPLASKVLPPLLRDLVVRVLGPVQMDQHVDVRNDHACRSAGSSMRVEHDRLLLRSMPGMTPPPALEDGKFGPLVVERLHQEALEGLVEQVAQRDLTLPGDVLGPLEEPVVDVHVVRTVMRLASPSVHHAHHLQALLRCLLGRLAPVTEPDPDLVEAVAQTGTSLTSRNDCWRTRRPSLAKP